MHVTIRAAQEADFPAADLVIQAAFARQVSFLPMLSLHREIQPDGLWVAVGGREIVGTVSAVDYGGVAYIGLMTVRGDLRGQGIARSLMETALDWLAARGGRGCVLLDATDLGAPVYERLGFVDDGHAYACVRSGSVRLAHLDADLRGAAVVRRAVSDDLPRIVELDARAFGADRAKLLAALWRRHADDWLVACEPGGRLTGYLVARDPVLGPWVCENLATAESLLVEAVRGSADRRHLVHVPRSNDACRAMLAEMGFAVERRLRHMRLGGSGLPGEPARLFGQSSFGHG